MAVTFVIDKTEDVIVRAAAGARSRTASSVVRLAVARLQAVTGYFHTFVVHLDVAVDFLGFGGRRSVLGVAHVVAGVRAGVHQVHQQQVVAAVQLGAAGSRHDYSGCEFVRLVNPFARIRNELVDSGVGEATLDVAVAGRVRTVKGRGR